MTREAFIRKWLGNPEKPYTQVNSDEMRDDLDKVIETLNPNPMTPTHYQFAEKEVIDMMASIWGNEAARNFLTLSAFKYQMRAGRKTDDPAADLEKARHCLEMATEYHVTRPETSTPTDHPSWGWKSPEEIPNTDEVVFIQYIDKGGFTCVKAGWYVYRFDGYFDIDGNQIANPIGWRPLGHIDNTKPSQEPQKENDWIDWNGFLDDPKPEPYVVVVLKTTNCSDGDVRHGFGYWDPRTNNWNTLLEFDKSRHSIQWKKIE